MISKDRGNFKHVIFVKYGGTTLIFVCLGEKILKTVNDFFSLMRIFIDQQALNNNNLQFLVITDILSKKTAEMVTKIKSRPCLQLAFHVNYDGSPNEIQI